MAGDNSMFGSDEGGNVRFNAGFFQIQRIHEVQRMINIAKINPTSYNTDYNIWNYELWFNCLNALLDEIWEKLSEKMGKDDEKGEKEVAKDIREKMINIVERTKVVDEKSIDKYSDRMVSVVNRKKWHALHIALINYDNFVRELMGAHGWNNPDADYEGVDEY